jgi:hypothetical protein
MRNGMKKPKPDDEPQFCKCCGKEIPLGESITYGCTLINLPITYKLPSFCSHYCAQSWCDAEDVDSWRDYCRENFIKVVI